GGSRRSTPRRSRPRDEATPVARSERYRVRVRRVPEPGEPEMALDPREDGVVARHPGAPDPVTRAGPASGAVDVVVAGALVEGDHDDRAPLQQWWHVRPRPRVAGRHRAVVHVAAEVRRDEGEPGDPVRQPARVRAVVSRTRAGEEVRVVRGWIVPDRVLIGV